MSDAAPNPPSAPPAKARSRRGGNSEFRRRASLVASFALLLLLTWRAATQPPRIDPTRPPPLLSPEWWSTPLEWNALQRIPVVRGTATGVASVPGRPDVWICGVDGLLLHSPDAGRTWETQPLPAEFPTVPAASAKYLDPAFAQAETGQTAPIKGQQPPSPVPLPPPAGPAVTPRRADLFCIQFVSDLVGWAVGTQDVLLITRDGGKTWTSRAAGTKTNLKTLDLHSPSLAWVGGEDGVWRTEDGGGTWIRLGGVPPGNCDLVRFETKEHGWVNISSRLHVTGDGGQTWKAVPMKDGSAIRWVSGPGRRTFWFGDEDRLTNAQGQNVALTKDADRERFLSFGVLGSCIRDDARSVAVGVQGLILVTSDMGQTWTSAHAGSRALLAAVDFSSGSAGWAVGEGCILGTADDGKTWFPLSRPAATSVNFPRAKTGWRIQEGKLLRGDDFSAKPAPLDGTASTPASLHFLDPDHGWVWLKDGTLLETRDGGAHWAGAGRHRLWFAPWYLLGILGVAGLFTAGLRRPPPAAVLEESVADVAISDRPLEAGDPDPLNFGGLARGLSRFLRNESTQPPITVAVTGAWGTGKSSLMNLLRADLQRNGLRPVWFNAWHHQEEENLLAAMLQAVRIEATPPLIDPAGLGFRIRLLGLRIRRYWRWSLLSGSLLVLSLAYLGNHPRELGEFLGAVYQRLLNGKDSTADPFDLFFQVLGPWLGVFGGAGYFLKAFRAFGVNPAELLASRTGNTKTSALEAQTSFRILFAREFHDVATALRPRTLTLFIDDLDRCSPENVLKVLESVNFLVSSGPCAVIMGLDLNYVRSAVKGILEAQIGKQFADRYLEKLVNLEVAVPTPTPEQMDRFLTSSLDHDARETAAALELRAWERLDRIRTGATLIAGVALFTAAFWIGSLLPAPTIPPDPGEKPEAAASLLFQMKDNPVDAGSGVREEAVSARGERSSFALGEETVNLWNYAFFILVPLAGAAAAVVGMLLRGEVVVQDSSRFKEALRLWNPVLIRDPLTPGARSTPRAVKRFLNRVRYLAMLQRPSAPLPESTLGLLRLFGWRGRLPEPEAPDVAIPEERLVALGMLQYLNAGWVEAPPTYPAFTAFLGPLLGQEASVLVSRLNEAQWRDTVAELPRFRALGSGFRLS